MPVNNNFTVIGTATSDFVEFKNEKSFTIYYLTVEIEKLGSSKGSKATLKFKFYNTNKAVNFYSRIRGHLIAVSGFLDSYYAKDTQTLVMEAIGLNVFLLDNGQIGVNENIQGIVNG